MPGVPVPWAGPAEWPGLGLSFNDIEAAACVSEAEEGLADLLSLRPATGQGRGTMDSLPIGDYALLSDCRSAAPVSHDGSVDWLCLPRFDGPSVFCRLLDPRGGCFVIRPAGEFQASRRYVDQTMVLETTFTTVHGTAELTDALAVGRNERGHELGANSPSMLLRRLGCTSGEIEAEVTYAPPAQAQALAGDVGAASTTFERAVAAINDVGFLSEEADPAPAR